MTIAQQIKWDFKTNGDLEIRDNNRNLIYLEDSDGIWSKWEYDSQGIIYHEGSNKNWAKYEFDSQGNEIYYENSNGEIRDNRPKPYQAAIEMLRDVDGETMEHILKAIGMDGQMLRQLILTAPMERVEWLMEEKKLHQS